MVDKRSSGVLAQLGLQCVEDSERWFGDAGPVNSDLGFQALCLAGEAGEVANLIKKAVRGSYKENDPVFLHDLAMEMADVQTYLLKMAGTLNIDLEAAYYAKRDYNQRRFTPARQARDAERAGNNGAGLLDNGSGALQDG
jgi:NTP pyrophosphatase (non-canonical NTP hydrolase)